MDVMEETVYGHWSVDPKVFEKLEISKASTLGTPIWKKMATKHEGDVLYSKYWNFWVRAGVKSDLRTDPFFRDFEKANANTDKLFKNIGIPKTKTETEEEVWSRIGKVWNWLKSNVQDNGTEYATLFSDQNHWPSILDFANYYVNHNKLVWAACFSKAHLFATLLGKTIDPRFRFAIAEAHHTEGGAPATASHVYVAAYVTDRWYYLDPTAIYKAFPDFSQRASIGVDSFATVDYEHPHDLIPVPLSGFEFVPYLPK
jgi:hypothetical protein